MAFKESFMYQLVLGHADDQVLLYLFIYEKEGGALGYSLQTPGTTIDPWSTITSSWTLWRKDAATCHGVIMSTTLLVKPTEKVFVGSPLSIFAHHAVVLDSYHTQPPHFL